MSGHDAEADARRIKRDQALAAAAERVAKSAPGLLIDADAVDGPPGEAVTNSGNGALMLVVGSRGTGEFAAMILGSVSRHAATHASCPVVVVRAAAEPEPPLVGIGIDEEENPAALAFAFQEAALRQASLIAIHSWHIPDADLSRAGPIFSEEPIRHAAETEAASRLGELLDNGGPGTPASRSARTSFTGTRAGRWSACPPAPTWSCWAGALGTTVPLGHARRPEPRSRPGRNRPVCGLIAATILSRRHRRWRP